MRRLTRHASETAARSRTDTAPQIRIGTGFVVPKRGFGRWASPALARLVRSVRRRA